MTKRRGLSLKKRFEFFKRDKFTCQYCGKNAPDVILQVDHIEPVSKMEIHAIVRRTTNFSFAQRILPGISPGISS